MTTMSGIGALRSRRVQLWAGVLAVTGAALAGFPVAAPLVLTLVSFLGRRGRLDFLMPGELAPVALIGGICALASALIARRLRMTAAVGLGLVVVLLLLVGVASVATGLASGATPAEGGPLFLVAGIYALYVLSVIGLFTIGLLVCRTVFAATRDDEAARRDRT